MSQESSSWLNTLVLIGYRLIRGNAWHYRAADQGLESNHYDGAIPVGDVVRRLFNFEVVSTPLFVPDGVGGYREVPGRQAMVAGPGAPVEGEVFGIFKDGYQGHPYAQWLIGIARNILQGSELGIGQAGLLRKGAQAWVSFELPENFRARDVEFRPQLLATTSYDGSTATTFKLVSTIAVCDNTREAALNEKTPTFRLKHTRFSTTQDSVKSAQDALGIIFQAKDAMAAEIEQLLDTEVTKAQFDRIVDRLVPIPVRKDNEIGTSNGRSVTLAVNKQDALRSLYAQDPRVAPWAGTAWGVAQAFNTFAHHVQTVKGTSRAQRNMGNALGNITANADALVLQALEEELQAA